MSTPSSRMPHTGSSSSTPIQRRKPRHWWNDLRKSLASVAPEAMVIVKEMQQGMSLEAPVEVRIVGEDIRELERIGSQVEELLVQVPFSVFVHRDYFNESCMVDVNVNEELANRLGITNSSISKLVDGAFDGAPGEHVLGRRQGGHHPAPSHTGVPLLFQRRARCLHQLSVDQGQGAASRRLHAEAGMADQQDRAPQRREDPDCSKPSWTAAIMHRSSSMRCGQPLKSCRSRRGTGLNTEGIRATPTRQCPRC